MIGEHTIKDAPEITAIYSSEEDGIHIESLNINGKPAGEFLENHLLAYHGDRWEDEILASLKDQDEQDRVDSILYDKERGGVKC